MPTIFNLGLLFGAMVFASLTLTPSSLSAQKRVCTDTKREVGVVKRRCRSPRFAEVSNASLKRELVVVNKQEAVSLSSSGDFSGNSAECPEGSLATGGGVSIIDNDGLVIRRSIPQTNLGGWSGSVTASKNNSSGTLSIYVICATDATLKVDEEEESEE